MKYMIMQLNQEKYLDDVLLALTEAGIMETLVISGETLGHKLTFDNPLFIGFRDSFGSGRGYGNIIFGLVESEDSIDFFLKEIKSAGVDFIKNNLGKIVLVPVEKVF